MKPHTTVFRLSNARAGEPYSGVLITAESSTKKIVYLDIKVPAELGLDVDLVGGKLLGTPEIAGDFTITVHFFFEGEIPAREYSATLSLLVIQNPKLMWKHLPSNPQAIFWKDDEDCASLNSSGFQMIAASKRGRSHAHIGTFRDDDYMLATIGEWAVMAVADGAGSAKYSRRGSQIICREAVAYLAQMLNDETVSNGLAESTKAFYSARSHYPSSHTLFKEANTRLHCDLIACIGHAARYALQAVHTELEAHKNLEANVRDFSSTAFISLCRRFPFGTLCAAYAVGDGAIGVYQQNEDIIVLGGMDSGEFAGQTRFLDDNAVTDAALAARTRFALVDDLRALILMTDGISDPYFETETHLLHKSNWDNFWGELSETIGDSPDSADQKLLKWLDFWSQGNHDDRTIALLIQEHHG